MSKKSCLPLQIVVAAMLLLLYSCKSAKEISVKYTYKALRADSVEPVRIISGLHPCVDGKVIPGDTTAQQEYFRIIDSLVNAYVPGETKYVHDTTETHEEKCIDLVRDYNNLVDEYDAQAKYIYNLQNKVKVKPPVVHDTIPVLDTKKLFIAEKEIDRLDKTVTQQKDKIASLKHTKLVLIGIIILLLLLIAAGLYFRGRRKLNPLN